MLANVETDVEIFGSGQMTEDDGNADWQGEDAVLEAAPGPISDAGASGSGAGSSGAGGSSAGGASGEGSSSGAGGSSGSGSRTPEKEGIRLYLGAVKEWMIEFGAGMLFLSIRTDGAWYRLAKPSPQYEQWYHPVLNTARLAVSRSHINP
jgi:DNA (cytosine-5)-methyltransferase 1